MKLICVMFRYLLLVLLSAVLISCASWGAQEMKADMPEYGDAIMQSNAEQILRNIVHLSYGEPLSFMKLTGITTSYSLSSSISPNASWSLGAPEGSPTNTSPVQGLGFGYSGSYSSSPNFSYTPLDDAGFVNMIEQPISFKHVILLYGGEANYLNMLLNLVFSNIGELDNASSATTSNVEDIPNFSDYKKFTHILTVMIKLKIISIRLASWKEQVGIVLRIDPNFSDSEDVKLLKKLFGLQNVKYNELVLLEFPLKTLTLNGKTNAFYIESSLATKNNNLIFVKMRSMSGILSFLSHSVQIPEADLKANYVQQFNDESGKPYNWGLILDDIMKVYESDTEPYNAFTKTRVHNHWFYIKMSDSNSKYTFRMIMKLMGIISGYSQSVSPPTSPIFTIPIGPRV